MSAEMGSQLGAKLVNLFYEGLGIFDDFYQTLFSPSWQLLSCTEIEMPSPPLESPLEKLSDAQKQQMQAERKRDMLLLVEHLASSQETTIKMIVDALYDIGAANLVDARVRLRPANRAMKSVARLSKPAFRGVALHWFKQNCPELIVNWLYSKVQFESEKLSEQAEETLDVAAVESHPMLVQRDREVKELRSQVRFLTSSLVAAVALFGGTSVWLGYHLQLNQNATISPPKTVNSKPFPTVQ